MNIFYLSTNPQLAARYLHDKHLVKMVLETAQILSAVCHRHRCDSPKMYRPTHVNHPCVRWAGDSGENYRWTVDYFKELLAEYKHRYDKTHASSFLYQEFVQVPSTLRWEYEGTIPALAMPDKYKSNPYLSIDDAVSAYRRYYIAEKIKGFPWWTRRGPPIWLQSELERING